MTDISKKRPLAPVSNSTVSTINPVWERQVTTKVSPHTSVKSAQGVNVDDTKDTKVSQNDMKDAKYDVSADKRTDTAPNIKGLDVVDTIRIIHLVPNNNEDGINRWINGSNSSSTTENTQYTTARKAYEADKRALIAKTSPFALDTKDLELSNFITTAISGDRDEKEIKLANISRIALFCMVLYLNHHRGVKPPAIQAPLRSIHMHNLCADMWDAVFIDDVQQCMDTNDLFYDVFNSANHLDIAPLIELCGVKLATLIKPATPLTLPGILRRGKVTTGSFDTSTTTGADGKVDQMTNQSKSQTDKLPLLTTNTVTSVPTAVTTTTATTTTTTIRMNT